MNRAALCSVNILYLQIPGDNGWLLSVSEGRLGTVALTLRVKAAGGGGQCGKKHPKNSTAAPERAPPGESLPPPAPRQAVANPNSDVSPVRNLVMNQASDGEWGVGPAPEGAPRALSCPFTSWAVCPHLHLRGATLLLISGVLLSLLAQSLRAPSPASG